MNSKKANLAFFLTIVCYIGMIYVISFLAPKLIDNLFLSNILVEMVVILPIAVFILTSGEKLTSFLGFRKMKISTVGMTILFTIVSAPFITLLNLISQLWVKNEVVEMMKGLDLEQFQSAQLFLSIAVVAPFAEELACRGMYYHSYKKSGSTWKAMLLSALIFAMAHMNFNQAAYAFGMGILAVLLLEATGSLWSTILFHGVINGSQAIMMFAILKMNPEIYMQTEVVTTDSILYGIGGYIILTAITLPLAWATLVWISGNEGRKEIFSSIFRRGKATSTSAEDNPIKIKKDKMITVSFILGLILCILMITGILPMLINTLILWFY